MANINVSPEKLTQTATQFNQASQNSREMVNRLKSSTQSLQQEWQGLAATRFYQDYTEWEKSMTSFTMLLQSISDELNAIAERFATVDQQR